MLTRKADCGMLVSGNKRKDSAMRECNQCKQTLPKSAFYRAGFRKDGKTRTGDGWRKVCKLCAQHNRRTLHEGWTKEKRQAHLAAQAAYTQAWMKKHHFVHRARLANLAAKRRGADGVLTPQEVQHLWEKYNGKCWVCGDDATQLDHYRPINKDAGGTNTADNVRPACKDCNHKRSHRWHGDALAEQEAVILKQLKELLK